MKKKNHLPSWASVNTPLIEFLCSDAAAVEVYRALGGGPLKPMMAKGSTNFKWIKHYCSLQVASLHGMSLPRLMTGFVCLPPSQTLTWQTQAILVNHLIRWSIGCYWKSVSSRRRRGNQQSFQHLYRIIFKERETVALR